MALSVVSRREQAPRWCWRVRGGRQAAWAVRVISDPADSEASLPRPAAGPLMAAAVICTGSDNRRRCQCEWDSHPSAPLA